MIENVLTSLKISCKTYEHEPLFTVDQAEKLRKQFPGGHAKNLLLRDRKKKLWLIVMDADTTVPIKEIGTLIDAKELSFAKSEILREIFQVEPGSVTPFGIINDVEKAVTLIIDKKLFDHAMVGFHPLRNTATTFVSPYDLQRFIEHVGHQYRIISFI